MEENEKQNPRQKKAKNFSVVRITLLFSFRFVHHFVYLFMNVRVDEKLFHRLDSLHFHEYLDARCTVTQDKGHIQS